MVTDACVVTDEWDQLDELADAPITMQDRLGATRAERHRERWNIDQAAETGHRRARRVVHRAIGNLCSKEVDAKDRRLLHYLESSLDGERQRSCIASTGNIAVCTDLSNEQVQSRLRAMITRGRVLSVEGVNGGTGYRVHLSEQEKARADGEVCAMWARVPVYRGRLHSLRYFGEKFSQFDNEMRLHWTRYLWQSSFAGFIKSAGIEAAQFVNRTGDAPFARVTCRLLGARTDYSAERMRQAIRELEAERLIDVDARYGRGDRGAGLEVRLRLVNHDELWRRHVALTSPNGLVEHDEEVGTKPAKVVERVAVR